MSNEDISTHDVEYNPLLPESETKAEIISPPSPPPPSAPPSSDNIEPGASSGLNNLSNGNHVSNGPLREEEDKISSISPAEDEDQVDECCRLTSPGDDNLSPPTNVIQGEPKSGEYAKIMELLKEAEAEADPEYETKKRNMEFLVKFNPRGGPNAPLGPVDYCCNLFQCCALCIEG